MRSEAAKCRAQAKYHATLSRDCNEVAEALEAAALALEKETAQRGEVPA